MQLLIFVVLYYMYHLFSTIVKALSVLISKKKKKSSEANEGRRTRGKLRYTVENDF